jgi:GT2 family glycosyltransferase
MKEAKEMKTRTTGAGRSPLASVCVVTRNEEKNLSRCLESLLYPVFPDVPFEILVIDNASLDGTRLCFDEFRERYPSIDARWIDRSQNHLGMARKQAVENARGEVVLFIDADCAAPSGWMDGLYQALSTERRGDSAVAAVGGGNAPPHDAGRFHDSLSAMLGSFIGSMGSLQARSPLARCEVDHLPTCNVAYSRAGVMKCGGFSEFFPVVGEDLELSWRLRDHGKSLIFVPGFNVIHYHRASFGAWWRKMFLYGRAQPRVASAFPAHLFGIRTVPALLFSFLTALCLIRPMIGGQVLVSYIFFVCVMGAVIAFNYGKKASAAVVVVLLGLTHLGYVLGEIYGAFEVFCFRE